MKPKAPESFFLADGAAFLATELTRGPWSNEHQHGGPPGALLGRGLERWSAARPPRRWSG